MILISTVALALAIAAAVYFGVEASKYSSQVLDKEMVISALQAQLESDKIKIAEMQRILDKQKSAAVVSTSTESVQKTTSRRRKPKQPKQD
jgi:hypothetical protein